MVNFYVCHVPFLPKSNKTLVRGLDHVEMMKSFEYTDASDLGLREK